MNHLFKIDRKGAEFLEYRVYEVTLEDDFNLTLKVFLTENLQELRYFECWDDCADASLTLFDRRGETMRTYHFSGCAVKKIQLPPFSWTRDDNFTVKLGFNYMEVEDIA